MDAYFAFTDECGQYQKQRSDAFIRAHPFYVRSTVIISFSDYLQFQADMEKAKKALGLDPSLEIKWSHYGSALKGNYKRIPHRLTPDCLKTYYQVVLSHLTALPSVSIYYTLTENSSIGHVNEISLLKMHLQNAFQRVQTSMADRDGFAIIVADDLNDKTKALKQAVYELTLAGDYIQYKNIKKGLYIDFSDQCPGLQIADICAGIFTATLKHECSLPSEKHKYQCGYDLFFSYGYKNVRSNFSNPPYFGIYKFGVKEVPNRAGDAVARAISRQISQRLESDLMQKIYGA